MPGKSVKITATTLAKLTPRDASYTVWDSEVRGLLVQVTPNDVRSWFVDYIDRTTMRRARRKIGDAAVLTPKEARDEARVRLGEVSRGNDPFEVQDAARAAGTFRKAVDDYLASLEGVHAKRTILSRRTSLKHHACAAFGGRPLLAVDRADVRRLHAGLAPKQPVTANRIVQAMRLFYRWCVETGRAPDGTDPTNGVKLAREPKQHRVFSADEYASIEAALDDEANVQESATSACECLRLMMLTGRRRDEARTLKWKDVDLDAGAMRGIATKTGRKDFPISAPAVALLKRLRKRPVISSYVFPSPVDNRKPVVNVNAVWDRVKVRAGITGRARIHDIRHSFAGTATALDIPIQSVAQLLGHENIATTARYSAAHEDHSRAVATKVAGGIAKAMRGKS